MDPLRAQDRDRAAGVRVGGVEEVGAAELLVAQRRELGEDQVALFVAEEEAVFVFDEERIGPAHGLVTGGRGEGDSQEPARRPLIQPLNRTAHGRGEAGNAPSGI